MNEEVILIAKVFYNEDFETKLYFVVHNKNIPIPHSISPLDTNKN